MTRSRPGRPSGTGRYREPTRVMRVPESQVPVVRELLRPLQRAGAEASATPLGPVRATRGPWPRLPLMAWPVRAGFPSPAEDDEEATLDLNEMLAPNPEATFLVRARGDSMVGAGIADGDVLIVDRSLEPTHGRIVVAVVDGDFTVKRLIRRNGVVTLEAAHPDQAPIRLQEGQELVVWGVVTRVLKAV